MSKSLILSAVNHFYLESHQDQNAEASHQWRTDASINGWSIMNEMDCWGNDVQIVGGFQNVEQCIDFWHWLTVFFCQKHKSPWLTR